MTSSHVTVLIVGAGPAGLVAALNLAKNGVTFRIIDKEPTYHTGTRGAGIQARTEELFHFLGILPDVQKRSLKLMPRRLYKLPGGTEPFETTSLSPPADPTPSTPYIDGMLISQSNTEDIIRTHLSKYGVQVELGTELHAFEQNEEQVTAHLIKHDDNVTEETVTCDWLIGTDGGRGATRKLLGLDFSGVSRQDEGAAVGEIEVEGLSTDYWHQWGDASTQLVLIRPTEFAGIFYFNAAGNVNYQLIQRNRGALIDFIYKATDRRDLKFGAVRWISEFRPNIRMVDTFGKGRVFVAGDAAHIHSPTGGQGLNYSVQDSFNLTWKLALVVKGVSPPSLLASYSDERAPVIRAMLGYTTELLDKLRTSRANVPGSLAAAWSRGRELKQLGVNYRWSNIVRDERAPSRPAEELKLLAYGGADPDSEPVQAGDRARDAP